MPTLNVTRAARCSERYKLTVAELEPRESLPKII